MVDFPFDRRAIVHEPANSDTIQREPETMQKTMQKDAKTIQKAHMIGQPG